jgi:hypothetical protein
VTCHGDGTTIKTVETTYAGRGRLHDPETGFTWRNGDAHEIAECDFDRLWDQGKAVHAGKAHRRAHRPNIDQPAAGDDAVEGIAVAEPAAGMTEPSEEETTDGGS